MHSLKNTAIFFAICFWQGISMQAISAELLQPAPQKIDRYNWGDVQPIRNVKKFLDVSTGYTIGTPLTAQKGDRLFKVKLANTVKTPTLTVAGTLVIEEDLGFLGGISREMAAGTYEASFLVRHPLYGELIAFPLPLKYESSSAPSHLLVDKDGKIFPEIVRPLDITYFSRKVGSVNNALLAVELKEKTFEGGSLDVFYLGNEMGTLTFVESCFDKSGNLLSKKERKYSDGTQSIILGSSANFNVTKVDGVFLEVTPISHPGNSACKR